MVGHERERHAVIGFPSVAGARIDDRNMQRVCGAQRIAVRAAAVGLAAVGKLGDEQFTHRRRYAVRMVA